MAANMSNKSRKPRNSASQTPATGNNAAYLTNASSRQPIHSKARINLFILGSWSVTLIMCLAFWAGVIALFM